MDSRTVSLMYHIVDSLSPFAERSVKDRDIDRDLRGGDERRKSTRLKI
jgi:hypothetical protein